MDQLGGFNNIRDNLKHVEQNIEIVSEDPIALHGFTQVPNFLFKPLYNTKGRRIKISGNARLVYGKFLSYAWNNNYVFPGQQTIADDLDMGRSTVTEYIGELKKANLLEIIRRGQGRTNLYRLHFVVNKKVIKTAKDKGKTS